MQTAPQKPGQGKAGGSADILECVYLTLFLDFPKSGKFLYTSATILIISNINRLQCTNSVLWGKMAASRSKWI